jgi:hypothetical protein
MPSTPPPIIRQTLKQAKRAYAKRKGPTKPSEKELREYERRQELQRRAEAIREREARAKENKKKKTLREQKIKEQREKWGKPEPKPYVSPHQPSLTQLVRKKPATEAGSEKEDDSTEHNGQEIANEVEKNTGTKHLATESIAELEGLPPSEGTQPPAPTLRKALSDLSNNLSRGNVKLDSRVRPATSTGYEPRKRRRVTDGGASNTLPESPMRYKLQPRDGELAQSHTRTSPRIGPPARLSSSSPLVSSGNLMKSSPLGRKFQALSRPAGIMGPPPSILRDLTKPQLPKPPPSGNAKAPPKAMHTIVEDRRPKQTQRPRLTGEFLCGSHLAVSTAPSTTAIEDPNLAFLLALGTQAIQEFADSSQEDAKTPAHSAETQVSHEEGVKSTSRVPFRQRLHQTSSQTALRPTFLDARISRPKQAPHETVPSTTSASMTRTLRSNAIIAGNKSKFAQNKPPASKKEINSYVISEQTIVHSNSIGHTNDPKQDQAAEIAACILSASAEDFDDFRLEEELKEKAPKTASLEDDWISTQDLDAHWDDLQAKCAELVKEPMGPTEQPDAPAMQQPQQSTSLTDSFGWDEFEFSIQDLADVP